MGQTERRRRRRRAVARIGAVAALVVAAVGISLALHGDGGSSPAIGPSHTGAWASRCFQSWNEHMHTDARLDTRSEGLSAAAVGKFAKSQHAQLAVVAKGGRCVGGWGFSASQAHLRAYLYVAFDSTDRVAAGWFSPGRGGVVSRPAQR